MAKVKLPKNIVEELDKLREKGISNAEIISNIWMNKESHTLNDYFSSPILLDRLVNALASGYEIEPSPEESILNYYNRAVSDVYSGDYELKYIGEASKEAIEYVLNRLDVKINGINQ